MAQHSGFFESKWDETLINPETGTLGDWDLKYYYNQFSDYFSKFFGNGVYYNPDNNLKVLAGEGLTVVVKAGWAFINGYWFQLDEDITLTVPTNSSAYNRVDSILLRWSLNSRTIAIVYAQDTNTVVRNDSIYELQLAEITVAPAVASILGDAIVDKRTDQSVCGIVQGLMADAIDTESLFAQYDAIFNEWFDGIKDQLVGDLGVRLQLEFDELNQNVESYYSNTQTAIGNYEQQIANQISGYNDNYAAAIAQATGLVSDYVDKDYVIAEQEFVFVNKVCTISDAKVTANSLIDVYFTSQTIGVAEDAVISVESGSGTITLTAENTPSGTIRGMIRVRVRS